MLISLPCFSSSLAAMGNNDNPTAREESHRVKNFGSFTIIIPKLNDSLPFNTSPKDEELLVLCQLFRGLVSINPETGGIEPDLAKSWEVLDDGTTYRFFLKKSYWSDGSLIRAEDFRKSIINFLSLGPSSQGSVYLSEFIKGAEDFQSGLSSPDHLGIHVLDDQTLDITFIRNFPFALKILAHYSCLIYPEELFKQNSFSFTQLRKLRTSGCVFTEPVEGRNGTELLINQDQESHGSKKVLFVEERQPGQGLDLYLDGRGDWLTSVPLSRLYEIDYRVDYRIVPDYTSYYYLLNTLRSPLDNPVLRKKLVSSVDRKDLVDHLLRGAQLPTERLVPPALYSLAEASQSSGQFSVSNPDRSELPEQDGSASPLQLIYPSNVGHQAIADFLVRQWAAAGLSVKPEPMEWIDFLKAREKGDYHIALGGWKGEYDDPLSFLALFLSAEKRWGGGYANPAFDDLLMKAEELPGGADRRNLLHSAESLLMHDSPFIPLYFNGIPQLINQKRWKGAPTRLPGYYTSVKYLHH